MWRPGREWTPGRYVRVVKKDGSAKDVLVPTYQPPQAAFEILHLYEQQHSGLPPPPTNKQLRVDVPTTTPQLTSTLVGATNKLVGVTNKQTAEIEKLRARVAELEELLRQRDLALQTASAERVAKAEEDVPRSKSGYYVRLNWKKPADKDVVDIN